MPSPCHANGNNIGIGIGIGLGKEEGSQRGETEKEIPLPPQLDDLSFLAAWEDWTAYRRERNLPPYKPRGLKAQRTRLSGWVDLHGMKPVIEVIRLSIANNYNGLFEPKTTPGKGNGKQWEPDDDYDNGLD